MLTTRQDNSLSSDLLVGARAIAGYLGEDWTPRRVLYAGERNALPVFRIGARRIAARRSEIDAALRARPLRSL